MEIAEIYSLFRKCGAVSTDSRTVKPGEMFIGLKGENFDGGDYAAKAIENGASYAVVNSSSKAAADEALAEGGKLIVVDDSLQLLQNLANLHRRSVRCDGLPVVVIGITGTNGKTTTKELLKTVLSLKFDVVATEGNFNNSIGVPLTLLRLKDGVPFAIVEMGASHPDDIKELAQIAEPDFGIITNVGMGHIEGFGSFDGVVAAKEEMYASVEEKILSRSSLPGKIFVNQDNPLLVEMASRHPGVDQILYGVKFQGAKILPTDSSAPFLSIQLASGREVDTHLIGSYNADNVMAAIKIGQFFGVSESDAITAIASYIPSNNRSQLVRTDRNVLIVDAYNANPSSMQVALDNFLSMNAENKIVMLGEMRELGTASLSEHAKVLRRIASAIDTGVLEAAYLVGEEFKTAADLSSAVSLQSDGQDSVSDEANSGLVLPSQCVFFADVNELISAISIPSLSESSLPSPSSSESSMSGKTILIKGSHGNRMDLLVPYL